MVWTGCRYVLKVSDYEEQYMANDVLQHTNSPKLKNVLRSSSVVEVKCR